MKFRLLRGCHVDNDPNGQKEADGRFKDAIYYAGDVIDTPIDLCRKFNTAGLPPKFERIDAYATLAQGPITAEELAQRGLAEGVAPTHIVPAEFKEPAAQSTQAALESMTRDELIAYAQGEEIDLGNVKNKESIIKAILAATHAVGAHG